MRKILLISSLFLFSCGNEKEEVLPCFDFNGITLCGENVPATEEIEYITNMTELQSSLYYPEVKNLWDNLVKRNTKISFIDKHMALKCEESRTDLFICENGLHGLFYSDFDVYIHSRTCLGSGALGHELLHAVEEIYLDGTKLDHSTPFLFNEYLDIGESVDILDIVENRIGILAECNLSNCEDYRNDNLCYYVNNDERCGWCHE